MNSIYRIVKLALEHDVLSRERKNKNRFVANCLWQKWNLDSRSLNIELLVSLIMDARSYERMWQMVLKDHVHLRGNDYDDKKKIVQNKQIELGYEPGFHENVKKLETL